MTESDFIGIRGWSATVLSINPKHDDNDKISYIVGKMKLLPKIKNRDVMLGGKNLSLDVFFHCYTAEVVDKFYKAVAAQDMLIVSGDLSSRHWQTDKREPNTNLWLDEFCKDDSNQTVSPLSGKINIASEKEFFKAANNRYSQECGFCEKENFKMAEDSRMYCPVCDD